MNADLAARFRAVAALQRYRDRHLPGSKRFDELDHAIDLALRPGRSVDTYLIRNAIRDAERVLRRRRRRGRMILESNHFSRAEPTDDVPSLADLLHDPASPESELVAIQSADQAICTDAAHARSRRVLECLVDGRTTREIAALIDVSPAYASVLSRRVKDAVLAAAGAART